MGPGLITGAADDDPSGIGTYSQVGASFGYTLLWLIPVSLPLMIAVQEMCGRLGLATGKGVAAVVRERFSPWILYSTLGLLVLANVLNVFADLNAMGASAQMLFGGPQIAWTTLWAVSIAALQVLMPYRTYSRLLKFLCLSLLAYVIVALGPANHNDWSSIARNLVIPSWSRKPEYLLAAVAFLGTTISPYLFFWQAGETVEESIAEGAVSSPGERTSPPSQKEIRSLRADTVVGMVASQAVAFFIILATAGTLHASGATDINTAQQAAAALRPFGAYASWVFALGMVGTGLLAIPTLAGSAAYAASEAMGWRYGLYRRFKRARGFYGTLILMVVAGYVCNFFSNISPIKALVYSAVANCVVAVPLMVLLLIICNRKQIMGSRTNGIWSNLFGVFAVILMGAASAVLIWGFASGRG